MKIKTSELIGPALDWAVCLANGYDEGWLRRQLTNPNPATRAIPKPSTNHGQDGGRSSSGKILPCGLIKRVAGLRLLTKGKAWITTGGPLSSQPCAATSPASWAMRWTFLKSFCNHEGEER